MLQWRQFFDGIKFDKMCNELIEILISFYNTSLNFQRLPYFESSKVIINKKILFSSDIMVSDLQKEIPKMA